MTEQEELQAIAAEYRVSPMRARQILRFQRGEDAGDVKEEGAASKDNGE